MANTVVGFSINIDGINSINDLNKAIKETTAALNATEDAAERLELQKKLAGLVAEQKAVKKNQDDLNKSLLETSSALGAYDKLSARLNRLRKEYKDLEVSGKGGAAGSQALLKEIQALDKQLKDTDAKVGQFQRNVGNYGDAFGGVADKLGFLGAPVASAIKGFQALRVAITAGLGPIGLIITAIGLVVTAIQSFFTSSEEGQNAARRLGAVFGSVFNNIRDVLAVVGGAIIKTIETIGSAINYVYTSIVGVNTELQKDAKIASDLAKAQDALDLKQRKRLVENAKIEAEIADKRNKVAQKDKFSNEERLKFLDEAIALEQQLLKENEKIAAEKLRIKREQNSLSNSRKEDLQEEAQLEADLIRLTTDNFNKTKELGAQRVEAINAIKSEEKAAEAERQKAYEEAKKRQEELTAARKKFQEDEKAFLEASARLNKSITEKTNALLTEFIADEFAKRRKVAEDAYNKEIEDLRNTVEESKKANQQRLDEAKKLYGANSNEFKKVKSDIDQEAKSATESLKQFETEREKKKAADIIQINKDEEAKKLEIKRTALKQAFDFAIKQDADTAKMLIEQKQIQFNTERALLDKNKKEDAEKILELERQLQQDIYFITANRLKDEQELIQNELKNNANLTIQEQTDLNNRLITLKNEEAALFADAEQKKRDEVDATAKKQKDEAQKRRDELVKDIEQGAAYTKEAISLINGFADAALQNRLKIVEKDQEANQRSLEYLNERLQRATGLERRYLEQRIQSEEQKAIELEKKKEQIEREGAKRRKVTAIIESIINTALAITKALPNPVTATIAGVLGAAQTAVIAAQPLAKGGVVGKGDEIVQFANGGRVTSKGNIKPLSNGDNVLATLKTDEIVLNKEQQRRIGYATLKKAQIPNFANGGVVGAPSTLITNANNSIANEQMRVNLMDEMISATNNRIDRLTVVYTATTDYEVEKGRNDKKTIKANSTF
jgi:hypothetical protein